MIFNFKENVEKSFIHDSLFKVTFFRKYNNASIISIQYFLSEEIIYIYSNIWKQYWSKMESVAIPKIT